MQKSRWIAVAFAVAALCSLTGFASASDFGFAGVGAEPVLAHSNERIEREQAFTGQNYTVIAPIYVNSNNNTSYIRFINANTTSSVTTVYIVGNGGAGLNYGSVTVTVPSGASPQYSINDILTAAGFNFANRDPSDPGIALYIRNPDTYSGFQNVIYNSVSGFFENSSICTYLSGYNYSFLNQGAMNLHTTQIAGYPSQLLIHNYLSTSVSMTISVYNARTGAFVGSYTGTATPNSQYGISMATIQNNIGWVPGPNDFHANILVTSSSTTGFYALVGQQIFNSALNTYINMSNICYINH